MTKSYKKSTVIQTALLVMVVAQMAYGSAAHAQAQLGSGRLLLKGYVNQTGCTVKTATGGTGDINIPMPGSLGVGKVRPLVGSGVAGWATLDEDVKYTRVGLPFVLEIECPVDDIYYYLDNQLKLLPPNDAKSTFKTKAVLSFYGYNNGASGFIGKDVSGSSVGVLAADRGRNETLGIAILHTNAIGGPALVDLDPLKYQTGVDLKLVWTESVNTIHASPSFDFAYVPADKNWPVEGGLNMATLPFKFMYK